VNTKALNGVPAIDTSGTFYFVSTRDHDRSLSTLYRGRFANGAVTRVEFAPGVPTHVRGTVDFDVDISVDGRTLYFAETSSGEGSLRNSSRQQVN
jgi:hypothetical protein